MNAIKVMPLSSNKYNSSPAFKLNAKVAYSLLFCQCINVALLFYQVTLWMTGIIALCLCWRGFIIAGKVKQPAKLLLIFVAIAGSVLLAISGKQLGLLLSMLHLMCFAYGLKTLEINSRKDFYQLILLGLFIVASAFIFSQSLAFSAFVFAVLTINLMTLLWYFSPSNRLNDSVLSAAKLLIQSLPLTILLFVIFPRLSPFWQVPLANSAKTGLSDTVTPGDIANLALNSDLAFRVEFENNAPAQAQMYWRALVLEDYDGKSWQRSSQNIAYAEAILKNAYPFSLNYDDNASVVSNYQVIAEPSYRSWLFALDVAQSKQDNAVVLPDFSLRAKKMIASTYSYQVTSYINMPMDLQMPTWLKRRNLSIPHGSNPKLEEYAQQLSQQYENSNDIVSAVLSSIRTNPYRYTLQPPLLENNSLDQFFFETQSGFCVHYASSFTYLMRAAGIPARMVTGYLGGELNPQANYYSIFQYDAHAWSEVWLEGRGWTRVDPTAAVNPDRVENGFSSSMSAQRSRLSNDYFSLHKYKNLQWVNKLRMQLEAIDYQWTRWVVGFTAERQYNLLTQWFGRINALKSAAITLFSLAGVMLILWLANKQWLPSVKVRQSYKLYQSALKHLDKRGIIKPVSMSAIDFSTDVEQKLGRKAQVFVEFSENFCALEYQMLPDIKRKQLIAKMEQQLKQIKQSI